ncbi:ATP-dependent helicase [Patescibacteria group bacterium]
MNTLSSLNPKQEQAVALIKGPVLVIAGPGSGKTKCLTHRIAHLIEQKIPAKNILAVTFTNKAAQEMKERVKNLIKNNNIPDIGTFHAICLQILRREIDKLDYKKQFVIYNEADQLSLMKQILKDLEISPDQFKPNAIQSAISNAKNELINYQEYQEKASDYFPQTVAKIYSEYQKKLKKANALDFDDLIMLTVQLFQKNLDILEKYQEKWKYILVDEAHDTNHSQYILINLLAKKYQNIWIIADPDQSIYSWRGADFRNVLNFEKDYPNTKTITLEQNYRSTKNILEASHYLITKNTQRKEKNLWTENKEGDLININETANEEEEGSFITIEIDNLINQGYNLKDIIILYRANAQSRAIEESLLKANIPYKIIGSVKFYDRKEIRDILSYLQFISNPDDIISLQRIINTPPRRLARYVKQQNINAIAKDDKRLQSFFDLMQEFQKASQKLSLTELISFIIKKIDYEEYIKKNNKKEDGEKRWENIQEIFTVANKYNQYKPPIGLEKFLEEIALISGQDAINENYGSINLMTIHCAKGLEFPVVFIIGCEDGIFPHSRSLFDNSQLEEERRLCYVALTRAKQKVYMTFARQRRIFGQTVINPPSRFILNLPEHLVNFNSYEY